MALGGGNFISQSKVIPGAYINVVSLMRAQDTLSGRGVGAFAMELDWGATDNIITLTKEDFYDNSMALLGYLYDAESFKGIRDFFLGSHTLHLYRLNGGEKAKCEFCEAKHSGKRGNDIKIIIQQNIENDEKFDVMTYIDASQVDTQTVGSANDLKPNAYVDWVLTSTLQPTAATPLVGGTSEAVQGTAHQSFLNLCENYAFNALGCNSNDEVTKSLYSNFCKRMRDDIGVKFQCVLFDFAADYEGCINLKNKVLGKNVNEASLVFWATGIIAGCEVNASNLNRTYEGDYEVDLKYTQVQIKEAIEKGEFLLHRVGDEANVVDDVNSLTTFTKNKSRDFRENQVIRVVDQIATDIAALFQSKYLGKKNNQPDVRLSLWTDVVVHHEKLMQMGALENFASEDVSVEQGEQKKGVVLTDKVQPSSAMGYLYMTIMVA